MRKLIVYIAMSLDGYIAGPGDDLSFLSAVETEGEDYGYAAFCRQVDTVIIGRKSYEKVLAMGFDYPHTDKQVYVVSRTPRPEACTGWLQFYSEPLPQLVAQLKSREGAHIYCDGGAEIVNLLLGEQLVDELILSVVPVLLGNGVRLFGACNPVTALTLIDSKSFSSGLVQLHYQRTNPSTY